MNKNQEERKKLPLTSDIVFKRVFSREGNEDILKALLEAILDKPIQEVIVKNPELPKNLYDSKAGVLDVKVEIDKNIICDVEMQVQDFGNIDKRSTVYMATLETEGIKKGEDYKQAKKVIAINLLNFEYYKRNSYHNIAHMKFEKTKENEYVDMGYSDEEELATNDLEMHFIEIPKFEKKNPGANTKLEQWLWLLAGREEKLEMARKKNKEIDKAIDIINQMSMDEKEWNLYISRQRAIWDYNTGMRTAREKGLEEGIKEGREEGIKEGIKEGAKQERLEIAKNMLRKELDIQTIKDTTGLTKEEIEKLKENK